MNYPKEITLFCFVFSAVTEIGHVYAWGDNDHGQQGNGTTMVNRKPALVHGLEGYKVCLQLFFKNQKIRETVMFVYFLKGNIFLMFCIDK